VRGIQALRAWTLSGERREVEGLALTHFLTLSYTHTQSHRHRRRCTQGCKRQVAELYALQQAASGSGHTRREGSTAPRRQRSG